MLYTVKIPGKKLAYDSASGAVIRTSALEYKMIGALDAPLVPVCQTSLRYELAKFDSETVSEAYEKLYGLQEKGILFAKENGAVNLRLDGEFSPDDDEEIDALLSAASECKEKKLLLVGGNKSRAEKVREIAKKYGFTDFI